MSKLIPQQDKKLENHQPARVGDICMAELPMGGVVVGIVLTVRDGIACKIRVDSQSASFVDNFPKLIEPIENFRPEVKWACGCWATIETAKAKLATYLIGGGE